MSHAVFGTYLYLNFLNQITVFHPATVYVNILGMTWMIYSSSVDIRFWHSQKVEKLLPSNSTHSKAKMHGSKLLQCCMHHNRELVPTYFMSTDQPATAFTIAQPYWCWLTHLEVMRNLFEHLEKTDGVIRHLTKRKKCARTQWLCTHSLNSLPNFNGIYSKTSYRGCICLLGLP